MRAAAVRAAVGAAVTVVVIVALSGCSRGVTRADLVVSYQSSNPVADETQAGCVVDALIEEFGLEGLTEELAAPGASYPLARYRAEFFCGMTDDVEDQLRAQLAARGMAADAADCVAETLTKSLDHDDLDVLFRGEMTDAFFDRYFVAVSDCGALPNQGE